MSKKSTISDMAFLIGFLLIGWWLINVIFNLIVVGVEKLTKRK